MQSDFPKTAKDITDHLRAVLDGIEFLDNNREREEVLVWSDTMRKLGMWGIPGMQVMIGIHNKCVLECQTNDPNWDKFDFYVAD